MIKRIPTVRSERLEKPAPLEDARRCGSISQRSRTSSSATVSTIIVAMLAILLVRIAAPGLEKLVWGQPTNGDRTNSRRHLIPPTDYLDGFRERGYPAISRASQELVLAFNARGVVGEILVDETEEVAPGQPLIKLKDDFQHWNVEVQRISAEDLTQIEQSKRRLVLAEYDLTSLEEAAKNDAASPRELIHARSDVVAIKLELRAAEGGHRQAEAAFKREQARLAEMTLRSTIHGQIVRIDIAEGEAVEDMQPVLRIVNVDPLWLDVAVPIQLGLRLKAGMTGLVYWRDVERDIPVDGVIKHVLPVADAASNSIVVRIEIENNRKLPSGLHALVQFPEMQEAWLRDARKDNR